MSILNVNNVSKTYANHKALNNVSLQVEKGEIFGLLGPNGAGKTTLIRMINQITAPDTGEILLHDKQIKASDVSLIGYLPEERGLYKKMKVGEQAVYLAELKGLKPSVAVERLKIWFEKFDILSWWDKKVEELSKGMQQKVQFITTVLHEPELLIFDEPFSGFDPINTNLLKEEIVKLKEKGTTIIFSTHNMASVEEVCDSIVLLNKAKNILEGKVKDIKQLFKKNEYEVIIPAEYKIENMLCEGCKLIKKEYKDATEISILSIEKGKNAELLSKILTSTDILSYREVLPSMNDIFIHTINNYKS
ncbi:MAG: ATP-binding cassette domain-containing protein [Bacteroidales bacterium]|jgi:ABC-2 type transport system ATP-binding protein|nr:ATP-binding cassette domain-containing protein [Bacteroidales bacterium]